MNSNNVKGDSPSIRDMFRDLVGLGLAAVQELLQPPPRSAPPAPADDDPADDAPPASKGAPPVTADMPVERLDRTLMVEAVVVDGQICLVSPPNEVVFGFLCAEVWTRHELLGGEDLCVHSEHGEDQQGLPTTTCVTMIQKDRANDPATGHVCMLEHPVLIGSGDHVKVARGAGRDESLPRDAKLIGYALGAIHPSRMGGVTRDPGRWPASFGRD